MACEISQYSRLWSTFRAEAVIMMCRAYPRKNVRGQECPQRERNEKGEGGMARGKARLKYKKGYKVRDRRNDQKATLARFSLRNSDARFSRGTTAGKDELVRAAEGGRTTSALVCTREEGRDELGVAAAEREPEATLDRKDEGGA